MRTGDPAFRADQCIMLSATDSYHRHDMNLPRLILSVPLQFFSLF